MLKIRRYNGLKDEDRWNRFVQQAKNATFLFQRSYMNYHQERFKDHSLMLEDGNKLLAVFPANEVDKTIFSHQGLTYGGLLTTSRATTTDVLTCFKHINNYYASLGFDTLFYKAIPHIYHQIPAEEDLYAIIQQCNGKLVARDISSTIDLKNRIRFTESRKSGIRKALKRGLTVCQSTQYDAFWDILTDNLRRNHHATPVHSLPEIQQLAATFPNNIKLFVVNDATQMLGGTVIYDMGSTIHTQYISASVEGKASGALDILFQQLLDNTFADRHYFDFGKSTEQLGTHLNTSLIFQKEGFGGRGICYDMYQWTL